MQKEENISREPDKKFAAVCGLYCKACSLFIATTEDPARLKLMAARFNLSEEEVKCCGCRSAIRGPYCRICKMSDCAAGRGIDFCIECPEYPCGDLKQFQSERPHRIELWKDLERIRAVGYERWLKEIEGNYACSRCGIINSAYDLKCRKCGREPSCDYTAGHRQTIEQFMKER